MLEYLYPTRDFDRLKFSKSDLEALEFGFNEYADKTFGEVLKKNHKHQAWIRAAERGGFDVSKETDFSRLHVLVDFADMVDDPEVLTDLNELGESTARMVV